MLLAGMLLAYASYVAIYNAYTMRRLQREMALHAMVIEQAIWTLQPENAEGYLGLAAARDNYEKIVVHGLPGGQSRTVEGPELTGLNRILERAGLFPRAVVTADIAHDGEVIGQLAGHHRDMNLYVHFYVLVLFSLAGLVFYLFLRTVWSKQEIEAQVQERTRELRAEIEERKKAEQARRAMEEQLRQVQKMEALGTLAGGIAHDFNNILAVILGFSEVAADEIPVDSKARGALVEIQQAARRAAELVKQILAFSRRGDRAYGPVRIQAVIGDTLKMLKGMLPSTIEIAVDLDERCGAVMADATEIHQIVMNLCTNAYHAMWEQGGILSLELKQAELGPEETARYADLPPGSYAQLAVTDTGHGIAPEKMPRIFDPYFTTKETGQGTGLGLATVHALVHGYGGAITAESLPGQGSAFTVLIPLATASAEPPLTPTAKGIPAGNGEHILAVDDEESLARLNAAILKRAGYRVTTFNSSGEALDAFRADPDAFDLVLTDQTMPRMTGIDLARQLLRIRPKVPIVLCTGHSDLVDQESAMAAGIRVYLKKPVGARALAQSIHDLLGEAQNA